MCSNIHHPSSYPDFVNIDNIWSRITQVLKLFGIYHWLGIIRGTLGYSMYLMGYVQQVPFFHNIHHPSYYKDTVNLGKIWSPIFQVPKLFGTQECVRHNFKGLEYVFHSPISYIWVIASLTIFCKPFNIALLSL